MWDHPFHGITREEGLSRQALCTSCCLHRTDGQMSDCLLLSSATPHSLPWPTASSQESRRVRDPSGSTVGSYRSPAPLSRAPLCPWVTENPPFPAARACGGESPPADSPLGGRVSFGIWRVTVRACRSSRAELPRKRLYLTLFGRVFLTDA